jgi:hypothetical protein
MIRSDQSGGAWRLYIIHHPRTLTVVMFSFATPL